ncbi:MAG: MarR family transcriptional regulator, partial [Actinomycetota bacterium]
MDECSRIDDTVTGWAATVSDLDVVTMRTSLLLFRTVALGRRSIEAAFADHGLSAGEFDVLASLLLAPDHTSKPSDLARDGMLSPAGMTHRLDLLEERGLL